MKNQGESTRFDNIDENVSLGKQLPRLRPRKNRLFLQPR